MAPAEPVDPRLVTRTAALYGYRVLDHRLEGRAAARLGFVVALVSSAAAVLVIHGCSSSKNATTPPPPAPDAGGTDAGGTDAAPTPQPAKTWDWTGIIGTGQSLSVGAQGNPIHGTTQPYNNLKLALGNLAATWPIDPTSSQLSMVPLVEPIQSFAGTYPSAYPANINGETPHWAMANEITSLFRGAVDGGDYITAHSVIGESGQAMSVIDKAAVEYDDAGTSTGRAYAATLFQVNAIQRLAAAANKTYGIGAIVITHGEADAGNTAYEQQLVQLWSDYNQDLKAITGQTQSIPMLVSQQHSIPNGGGSASTLAQWKVGVDHEGDIICTGPKYQYPYFSDGVHLLTPGYEQLGEKYAEVYYERVVLGHDWQPLQPTTIDKSGTTLTVHFHVPVEPMVWDTTLPMPHQESAAWSAGRGFEVSTLAAPVTILSVAIQGDTVVITCDRDLTGMYLNVGYAFTSNNNTTTPQNPGGTFRWGLLRDSDAFVGSQTGTAQPNFAVSFTMVSQ